MSADNLGWIVNFIWGIADDVLRDVYVRGKYRDVILPMVVLRRLDAVLEPAKQKVLVMKQQLDDAGIVNQDAGLRSAAGPAFYNTSPYTLRDLASRAGIAAGGRLMPRQNRVTPWGEIISTPARGTLMGNRGGCLHDAAGQLGTARWRSAQWIACLLEFRGRRRAVMSPGRYTELFFLDEATALAAGHRPCAECRRPAFNAFRAACLRSNPDLDPAISAPDLDRRLHAERVDRTRQKLTAPAAIDDLPDGVFVTLPEAPGAAFLLWHGALHRWSPSGYDARRERPVGRSVTVLTPRTTVAAISAGYAPGVHGSVALAHT